MMADRIKLWRIDLRYLSPYFSAKLTSELRWASSVLFDAGGRLAGLEEVSKAVDRAAHDDIDVAI
eukprot:SAG11_NODE_8156_length_1054_cov_1.082723_2_plen_65_part_00